MPPSSKRRHVTTDRVTNNVDPAETRSESETDISESEEDDVEEVIDQQQDTPTGPSSQLNEMDYAYDLMPGEVRPTTFLAYKNPYMSGRVIVELYNRSTFGPHTPDDLYTVGPNKMVLALFKRVCFSREPFLRLFLLMLM